MATLRIVFNGGIREVVMPSATTMAYAALHVQAALEMEDAPGKFLLVSADPREGESPFIPQDSLAAEWEQRRLYLAQEV